MGEKLDHYRARDFRPRLEYRLAWKSVLKEHKLRPERALKLAIDALAEKVNLPKRELPQLETVRQLSFCDRATDEKIGRLCRHLDLSPNHVWRLAVGHILRRKGIDVVELTGLPAIRPIRPWWIWASKPC